RLTPRRALRPKTASSEEKRMAQYISNEDFARFLKATRFVDSQLLSGVPIEVADVAKRAKFDLETARCGLARAVQEDLAYQAEGETRDQFRIEQEALDFALETLAEEADGAAPATLQVVHNTFNVEQAAAVGPNATANNVTMQQINLEALDLATL